MTADEAERYQEFAREKLGFEFKNIDLLVAALTHRSYHNEHKESPHNERLECLGDAVLEMVTSDYLYRHFVQPEGVMTSWRSSLVRTESIGAAGRDLGYSPLIRLSKGESRNSARARTIIIADCFEAVAGAIYIDQGYQTVKDFINKHIITRFIDDVTTESSWHDPKTYLQELVQQGGGSTPQYRTIREEGPDHDKSFTVGVVVSGHLKGIGHGHSKQEAQVNAALVAIKRYQKLIEKADSKNPGTIVQG